MDIKDYIRIIEDFPKAGISFKDITTLVKDGKAFKYTISEMVSDLKDKNIDIIVGPESRGFIIGAPIAYELGIGFVPIRKPNKLPADTIRIDYELEYGSDALEVHKDAIKPGQRVAIVDDLLATGGTILSVAKLIEQLGGVISSINFIIELTELKGREKLKDYPVSSLITYDI